METAGATNGLHLLSTTFFTPGDLVFTEDFTYFLAIQMFKRTIRFNIETGKMYMYVMIGLIVAILGHCGKY